MQELRSGARRFAPLNMPDVAAALLLHCQQYGSNLSDAITGRCRPAAWTYCLRQPRMVLSTYGTGRMESRRRLIMPGAPRLDFEMCEQASEA